MMISTLGILNNFGASYLGSVQKLHHPGTREGGVSEKMILDYVGGGRGIAKDDG